MNHDDDWGVCVFSKGMSNLLAESPEFEDFREIQQINKRESYLFNGPLNTYNTWSRTFGLWPYYGWVFNNCVFA